MNNQQPSTSEPYPEILAKLLATHSNTMTQPSPAPTGFQNVVPEPPPINNPEVKAAMNWVDARVNGLVNSANANIEAMKTQIVGKINSQESQIRVASAQLADNCSGQEVVNQHFNDKINFVEGEVRSHWLILTSHGLSTYEVRRYENRQKVVDNFIKTIMGLTDENLKEHFLEITEVKCGFTPRPQPGQAPKVPPIKVRFNQAKVYDSVQVRPSQKVEGVP